MSALDPQTRAWALLLLAGAFEIGFTTSMNFMGKGRWWAEVIFILCIVASFACLQAAAKTIPIAIAYAVWTGVGAAGTLAVSVMVFRQPLSAAQIAFVVLLVVAVAGLKLTGQKA